MRGERIGRSAEERVEEPVGDDEDGSAIDRVRVAKAHGRRVRLPLNGLEVVVHLHDELLARRLFDADAARIVNDALPGRPRDGNGVRVESVACHSKTRPAGPIRIGVIERLHHFAVGLALRLRRLVRVDEERDHVVHDGGVADVDFVVRDESARVQMRVDRKASVLVVLRKRSALCDGRDRGRRVIGGPIELGHGRDVVCRHGPLHGPLVDPRRDRSDLRVAERFSVLEIPARPIVRDEIGRHGLRLDGRDDLRSVSLRVGVRIEPKWRDASGLMTLHAFVVEDRRDVDLVGGVALRRGVGAAGSWRRDRECGKSCPSHDEQCPLARRSLKLPRRFFETRSSGHQGATPPPEHCPYQ